MRCSSQRGLVTSVAILWILGSNLTPIRADEESITLPSFVKEFVETHCFDCHGGGAAEGGLALDEVGFDLDRREVFERWVLIHDRIRDGEMPPPENGHPKRIVPIGWSSKASDGVSVGTEDLSPAEQMLIALAGRLLEVDRRRVANAGRAKVRRLNRFEYENTLAAVLDAPWLEIAEMLPEDGVDHLYNKVGERLDVSHVQMTRYLTTAEHALRLAVNSAAYPTTTRKFYAREEPSMHNYLHYRFGQMAATRSIVPLVGLTPEPDVIRKKQPFTVGDADPAKRELEAMGVFSGVYSATTKYDFTRIDTPIDGNYRLRFRTYTFRAGPNGADGGDDHGLTGGNRAWWRPDRNVAFRGERSEPITLYALAKSGDSRWLTTFDSHPEPTIFETHVTLRQGEGIRPDAARLVRTRPGWSGNPNATEEGVPGFAMNWLEVEGPLHDSWPPPSYRAIFDDLPFEISADGEVKAISESPLEDAERLITRFYRRANNEGQGSDEAAKPFVEIFTIASSQGYDFTDATIAAMSAVLCSPDFLYLESRPGTLSDRDLRERLAYFLWNGPPDLETTATVVDDQTALRRLVDQMLDDRRSERFVSAFLDYWLDLRKINANTPDAELYPDYYLDELLTESSLRETRMFFQELIRKNLPVRNLVESDFTFANERLAEHYRLPRFEGVEPRRVELPKDSPRGGLLTQASVLRVTANGTTTSPVIRGAWVTERLMGIEIPPPPSGVAAVEPDTRGATTIREQLDKHRAVESCNACHAKFDPAGFALESFDVAGGWRDRYRAVGDEGEPVEGIGKNGHAFRFKLAQPIDCQGTLMTGESFEDIRDLKQLLLNDERQLARNMVYQFLVYATGAPVSFSDRGEVEKVLDLAEEDEYGLRTLIHQVVLSPLFRKK